MYPFFFAENCRSIMGRVVALMLPQLPRSIGNHLSPLHQHTTQPNSGCIRIHHIRLARLRQCQYWCTRQHRLQVRKTLLILRRPLKRNIVRRQLRHRLSHTRETLDEPPIITRQPKKTPNLGGVPRPRPISDGLNLFWIDPRLNSCICSVCSPDVYVFSKTGITLEPGKRMT